MTVIATPSTSNSTVVSPNPLQQLASVFQQAGITPNMQASSAAPASQLPQNQVPQTQVQQGRVPPAPQAGPGALAKLATMFPDLASSLGMGTQQSGDTQTPDYQAILNMLNGTTVNGTDQVTAQPSFLNSISKMLP